MENNFVVEEIVPCLVKAGAIKEIKRTTRRIDHLVIVMDYIKIIVYNKMFLLQVSM